jgi:hypothetical protein
MRSIAVVLTSLLAAGAALAQTPPSQSAPPTSPPAASAPAAPSPGTSGTAAPTRHRTRRSLAERFDAANTTHDGKLTLEQARAGHLNAVARDFAQIDKQHRGYVTIDDIRTYRRERRAARRAAHTTGQSQPPQQQQQQ